METKNIESTISEEEFIELVYNIQKDNDEESLIKVLNYFENDIVRMSRFIKMPKEDAIQYIKVELIELLKKENI